MDQKTLPNRNESETRTELIAALQSLSVLASEMRAGQLMAAVGELCVDMHGRGLWDATDVELLEAVWHFHKSFAVATARSSGEEA